MCSAVCQMIFDLYTFSLNGHFNLQRSSLCETTDRGIRPLGSVMRVILTNLAREQIYGAYDRPRDYLESFTDFIRQNINESAALAFVVNRPRDLARAQLREIRLLLDRDFINRVFARDGGDRRLDNLLEERLDTVLEKLAEAVWDSAR